MTISTPPACPRCGSSFTIDTEAQRPSTVFMPNPGGMPYLEERLYVATVAFCNGCEFALDLRDPQPPQLPCDACDGTGDVAASNDSDDALPCATCGGTGRA